MVLFTHKLQGMNMDGSLFDRPIKVNVDNSTQEIVIKEVNILEPTIGHLNSGENSIIALVKEIKNHENSFTTKQDLIDNQDAGEPVLNKLILETINNITSNGYKIEALYEKAIKNLLTTTFALPGQVNKQTLLQDKSGGVYLQARDYDLLSIYDQECIKKKLKTYCELVLNVNTY